jgi:hypothetical protein
VGWSVYMPLRCRALFPTNKITEIQRRNYRTLQVSKNGLVINSVHIKRCVNSI